MDGAGEEESLENIKRLCYKLAQRFSARTGNNTTPVESPQNFSLSRMTQGSAKV